MYGAIATEVGRALAPPASSIASLYAVFEEVGVVCLPCHHFVEGRLVAHSIKLIFKDLVYLIRAVSSPVCRILDLYLVQS